MSRKKRLLAKPGPGYEGRYELGTAIIDDPYQTGAKDRVSINKRHDVLVHWRSRNQIDEAQFLAGQKVQQIWYRAQGGRVGSCIQSNTKVDSSGAAGPDFYRLAAAADELRAVAAWLGHLDYTLVIAFVCEGRAMSDAPKFVAGHRPERIAAWLVRRALSSLADYWGAKGHRHNLPITVYHAGSEPLQ